MLSGLRHCPVLGFSWTLSPSIHFNLKWTCDTKLSFLDTLVPFLFLCAQETYELWNIRTLLPLPSTPCKERCHQLAVPPLLWSLGRVDFLRGSFSKLSYLSHVIDVALSRTLRPFYHDPSRRKTFHLLVLSLPYTEEIYFLRHLINCRFFFYRGNTGPQQSPLISKVLFLVTLLVGSNLVRQALVSLSVCPNMNTLYPWCTTARSSFHISGT